MNNAHNGDEEYISNRSASGLKKRVELSFRAAGTLVAWDVDLLSDAPIKVYRTANPDRPTVYCRGDAAEAEPALPGWRMPVEAYLYDCLKGSEMIEHTVSLTNRRGLPFGIDIRRPVGAGARPIVIICHGFKGFKDFAFFPYTSRKLCEQGFAVVTMNFSGNGIGDEPQSFTALDKFAQNTISQELDDVDAVLEGITAGTLFGSAGNPQRIGIMGHSRGGCTAIVKASLDPRLTCLVTWASPAALGRYSDEVMRQWKEDGRYNFMNARTKQDMFVNYTYLEDIQANRDRYSLDLAVSKLTIPYLTVHGVQDESVAVEAAHRLHGYAKTGKADLALVEGGTHTFGTKHPFEGATPALEQAIDRTAAWFRQWLS
jgi:dienelactone hydrolase